MKATLNATVIGLFADGSQRTATVALNLDTATNELTSEASELRFPAGRWPVMLKVKSEGNEELSMRRGEFTFDTENDVQLVNYWGYEGGAVDGTRITMNVLND